MRKERNGSGQKQAEPKKKAKKQEWKPGNMLYPLPVVMVSCIDSEGRTNILTVAWTGTVCTNPPMLSISVRPERYSCRMIRETGEFVVNLTTEALARAADLCGVKSGRDVDKWKEAGLTPVPARQVKAPLIGESPVNLECRVEKELALGSHIMFVARVVSVSVDEAYLDEKGSFRLDQAGPVCYSHGTYFSLGKEAGKFGFSVAKKKTGRKHT
ncbi:MAG TPA: flavin reductase family protein [Candidatus Eisenbergiella stercorigallinarum]|uniref:Flavin reductase family protein n=1 Tax=Candidatus Eisenbergiella stercorigallinarum TaxID=2838557 RepID=A0A9D2R4Q4_9FIRM|nr:flavin reductase family protein [Candidatus Eisenbergiella stercorigallinarum]